MARVLRFVFLAAIFVAFMGIAIPPISTIEGARDWYWIAGVAAVLAVAARIMLTRMSLTHRELSEFIRSFGFDEIRKGIFSVSGMRADGLVFYGGLNWDTPSIRPNAKRGQKGDTNLTLWVPIEPPDSLNDILEVATNGWELTKLYSDSARQTNWLLSLLPESPRRFSCWIAAVPDAVMISFGPKSPADKEEILANTRIALEISNALMGSCKHSRFANSEGVRVGRRITELKALFF